jgi:predicted TIM-barrel fold metal-dependent hydrolase
MSYPIIHMWANPVINLVVCKTICLSPWYQPGKAAFSNKQVAEFTRAFPDRFVGIAGVDLIDPVSAMEEIEKYVKEEV